jgi:hypothetical protein
MMTPELRAEELKDLHKEANELYSLYFKRGASHKVDVSPELVQEIFTSRRFSLLLVSGTIYPLTCLA